MAILPPVFRQRYFTATGAPLAGGKLYTYQAGTTTPLVTYTDATEASANTNPIILDANGECNLWLGGNAYKITLTDADDVVQWTQDNINQASINSSVSADLLENLGISCQSPGGGTIILSVKTGAGNNPSLIDPIRVGFRSANIASGLVSLVSITSPLAMNLANGATLGHSSGVSSYVYVYLINNNGTAELAVSSAIYQEDQVVSTTAMTDASDSPTVIYSTVARSNVPIRLIARLTSNQVTAGVWVNLPTEIQTGEEARRSLINTNQIANLAVTTAKIADGAITNSKKGPLNYAETASVVANGLTNTSFVDRATIASFTSLGRPCLIGYAPTTEDGYVIAQGGGGSDARVRIRVWDQTNSVALGFLGQSGFSSGPASQFFFTPSALTAVSFSSGTREIRFQSLLQGGAGSQYGLNNIKFFIMEL